MSDLNININFSFYEDSNIKKFLIIEKLDSIKKKTSYGREHNIKMFKNLFKKQ